MRKKVALRCTVLALASLVCLGCGETGSLLNPSFANYALGGIYPVVPGASSGFVLARVINSTSTPTAENIRFVVTAERQIETTDDTGETFVETIYETVRLQTYPQSRANEVGVLFDCPVTRVGLGENIDFPSTEPGLFIGAVPGEAEGYGVPGHANPLSAAAGNFQCGDTLIFEAISESGSVGNVRVTTYVLGIDAQPPQISGPDTFNNARTVIEEYRFEED